MGRGSLDGVIDLLFLEEKDFLDMMASISSKRSSAEAQRILSIEESLRLPLVADRFSICKLILPALRVPWLGVTFGGMFSCCCEDGGEENFLGFFLIS